LSLHCVPFLAKTPVERVVSLDIVFARRRQVNEQPFVFTVIARRNDEAIPKYKVAS
jgi:hypothetical protein